MQNATAHIAIDYRPALLQPAGVGRYTRGLIRAAVQFQAPYCYTLLITRDTPATADFPPNVRLHRLPLSDRCLTVLWHRLRLPLPAEALCGAIDLFHSPNFVLPPIRRAQTLVTVHDLSFIRYPAGAEPALRAWLERAVPRSLEQASHILADSENTRQDLIDIYGCTSERVSVVGAGVDASFRRVNDPTKLANVRRKYRLPPRFILGLGRLEPRKNFTGLIAAFELLADQGIHLVIAGGDGWLYEGIYRAREASPAADRIHFTGYIDESDLPVLYSLADLFAFPSHYEGFGIPVLEALACGTPVVCADNSSLPEVAGDAALLVKAEDSSALAEAIERVLSDPMLREALVERGRQRVASFTWERAAGRLIEVYRRLLNPTTIGASAC